MGILDINYTDDRDYLILDKTRMSSRQAMKFNIFLRSLSGASVSYISEDILIKPEAQEKQLRMQVLLKIMSFLENQGFDIHLDEDISEDIKAYEAEVEHNEIKISSLRSIAEGSATIQSELDDFSAFCDRMLKIKLRPYQYKAAYRFCVGEGGFEFSVPGSGKTIITYAAYAFMKAQGNLDHIFVIGPGSSYNAWYDEYHTCFDEDPEFENLAELSSKDAKDYLLSSRKNHKEISFINIEKIRLLTSEISEYVSRDDTLLVVDEAHKVKNPNAAATASVLKITKKAKARIILTGTPMPNGYEDLLSLTEIFSPYSDILPYNYNQLRLMSKSSATKQQTDRIRDCIKPYYSRISKKYLIESKELLPAEKQVIYCDMQDEQRYLYDRLNDFFNKTHDDVDEDILVYFKKAMLIRKMQISSNPALLQKSLMSSMDELAREKYGDESKDDKEIEKLVKADQELMTSFMTSEIVKIVSRFSKGELTVSKNDKAIEVAADLIKLEKKVLIWDIFVKNMDVLRSEIENSLKVRVEMVNGSVVGADRQQAIKNFREGDSMILLANPATLAESISLHRVCQNAIYVNRNFNAAQFIQSKDRIHRINMPEGTTAHYYYILNNDSVDSAVDEKLIRKEQRMLDILDAEDIEIGGAEMEDSSIMSMEDIEDSYMR